MSTEEEKPDIVEIAEKAKGKKLKFNWVFALVAFAVIFFIVAWGNEWQRWLSTIIISALVGLVVGFFGREYTPTPIAPKNKKKKAKKAKKKAKKEKKKPKKGKK